MKKVYVISHSHWDREWYLPYEQHHMRLVELIDDLLELFEKDPEFKGFHLDGQTIILEDYLEVKPENREILKKYIEEGKFNIGPFYILQDDFLISSEANARNILIGFNEAKKWGKITKIGYFPDTFGNMGQAPQLLAQAGIDVAAFGRGVKPTGFDNVVIDDEKYSSQYSEMWWKGADGTKVLGILFANWYSNGNEIPVDKEEAKIFWDKKLKDVEKYASTEHLLLMNGCDHQPVQKNLSEALRVAKELYPDIEFIHSSFEEYMGVLKNSIPKNLQTVDGELTSQETDGWFTLANTASARVYLKQWNTLVQCQLENIAEPLSVIASKFANKDYPHSELNYGWKALMKNHPHDSICGCSVDEVHREMVSRFEKAYEVGKFVADEAGRTIVKEINTKLWAEKKAHPFVVFNTSGYKKTGTVEAIVNVECCDFKEAYPTVLAHKLKAMPLKNYVLKNSKNEIISAKLQDLGVNFGYDLPKDCFRKPYMARQVKVTFNITDMAPLSWDTFALVEAEANVEKEKNIISEDMTLENEYITVKIEDNGTLTLFNKETNKKFSDLLVFEDAGDIGNEYIFKQPQGDKAITTKNTKPVLEVVENNDFRGILKAIYTMLIPKSADVKLDEEMKEIVDIRDRKAKRSEELVELKLEVSIILEKGSKQVKFEVNYDNTAKNHRLRVLFPTKLQSDVHYADSIFEVVKRKNEVAAAWENPTNPQHQNAFVNIHNEEGGFTAANFGLNEYEVLKEDNTIAITLLRAVGELGDWGYFPTEEAQCLGKQKASFAIECHGKGEETASYQRARAFQVPFMVYTTNIHEGSCQSKDELLKVEGDALALTAVKCAEGGQDIVTRFYNMTDKEAELTVEMLDRKKIISNILEEKLEATAPSKIKAAEIVTYIWE